MKEHTSKETSRRRNWKHFFVDDGREKKERLSTKKILQALFANVQG